MNEVKTVFQSFFLSLIEILIVPWLFEAVFEEDCDCDVCWSFWLEFGVRFAYEHWSNWHLFDLSTVGGLCLAEAAVVMPVDRDIWLNECVWLFFGLRALKLQTTVPVEVVLVAEDSVDSVVKLEDSGIIFRFCS